MVDCRLSSWAWRSCEGFLQSPGKVPFEWALLVHLFHAKLWFITSKGFTMDDWLRVREKVSLFITTPLFSNFRPPYFQKAISSCAFACAVCVCMCWFMPVKAKDWTSAKGHSREQQCAKPLIGILFTLLLLALITCFFELNKQLSLESLVPDFKTEFHFLQQWPVALGVAITNDYKGSINRTPLIC